MRWSFSGKWNCGGAEPEEPGRLRSRATARTEAFAAAARHACEVVNAAPDRQESMDWLERVSVFDDTDAAR